jgi:hypothetical protein
MKLGRFTAGYILTTGIAAVIFIYALKFVGSKFPQVPIVGPISRGV